MPDLSETIPEEGLLLGPEAAAILFPFCLTLDHAGRILTVGRTLARIFDRDLAGTPFTSVFTVTRPRFATSWDQLRQRTGVKLHLTARPDSGAPVTFRGIMAPFGPDRTGALLDLSFGLEVSDAIARFDLTRHDFRADDSSIDTVYTLETQRSLLEDSARLAAELKAARDEAEQRANIDPVTGIANRRALHDLLGRVLSEKEAHPPRTHALLHLDLDKFKPINDTFGHTTGDEVLVRISALLSNVEWPGAVAARVGGDEFVLYLPDVPSRSALDDQLKDLLARISAPLHIDTHSFRVGASIGAVHFSPSDYTSSDQLLQHSDIALYEAKKTGNTCAHLTASMLQKRHDNAELINAIERGIEQDEFLPHFQLQIDAISNLVHGAEVLARWEQADGTVAGPPTFLKAATHAGLMDTIDTAVRTKAISIFAAWRRMGLRLGGISLNLSPSNLRSTEFCEAFQDEVFAAGLSPQSIRLELLESILFDQTESFLVQQSHQLHRAGFPLVLDDFGTGHASIATLVDIPVSMIKIDRSFVQGIDYIPKKRRIAASMLALADSLGLRVMAEGVETQAEISVLKNAGCRYFQGFHFARPLPAADTAQLLRRWESSRDPQQSSG